MDIEIFSLCDAATQSFGKLNILGAFDALVAETFPLIYPQCAIAMRIRFRRTERGGHAIEIALADEDGRNVIPPLTGAMEVQFLGKEESAATNLVINMNRIEFKKEGDYSINVTIDNEPRLSIPLFIRRAPNRTN